MNINEILGRRRPHQDYNPERDGTASRLIHTIPLNIKDMENEIIIIAEASGVEKKDIEIEVFQKNLLIKYKKENPIPQPNIPTEQKLNDISYGNFSRTIKLPICLTKEDSINTKIENGIITIIIDKTNEESCRFRVPIT